MKSDKALVTNPASGAVSAQAVPATPARQGAAGGAGGGRGRLAGLLGAFNKRAVAAEKRVVGSRIIERAQAGKWI